MSSQHHHSCRSQPPPQLPRSHVHADITDSVHVFVQVGNSVAIQLFMGHLPYLDRQELYPIKVTSGLYNKV